MQQKLDVADRHKPLLFNRTTLILGIIACTTAVVVLLSYYGLRQTGLVGQFVSKSGGTLQQTAASSSLLKTVTKSLANREEGKHPRWKTVLFWTNFFGDNWRSHFADFGTSVLPGSDNPNDGRYCYFTTDRSKFNEAEAVVFHGRDFNFNDMPQTRSPAQRWVFYLLESPENSHFNNDQWRRASKLGFNWTMSYTKTAHVWIPYCFVVKLQSTETQVEAIDEKIKRFADNFHSRPKDMAWFVSHCGTGGKREKIVDKLRALGISVDSWGGCSGKRPDKEIESMGIEAFFAQYRFYFAAENSLCTDYATEKLTRGLHASIHSGVIPVVYGDFNYSAEVAPNSVIDVGSFKSVEQLVYRLLRLKDPTSTDEVLSYFEWQKQYTMGDCVFTRFGFTNLCKKLFAEEDKCSNDGKNDDGHLCQNSEAPSDIRPFFGNCRSPTLV